MSRCGTPFASTFKPRRPPSSSRGATSWASHPRSSASRSFLRVGCLWILYKIQFVNQWESEHAQRFQLGCPSLNVQVAAAHMCGGLARVRMPHGNWRTGGQWVTLESELDACVCTLRVRCVWVPNWQRWTDAVRVGLSFATHALRNASGRHAEAWAW